jgi:SAM-dependent MidA family methyltransferase
MGILKGVAMRENEQQHPIEVIVRDRIRTAGGMIPFAAYMEVCLYEPTLGYYHRDETKLGKEGDFYTSAHIGSVMGQCIAVQLHKVAGQMSLTSDPVKIVEWGGGDGRLAEAVLTELRQSFPQTYERVSWIGAESSPYHRRLQRTRLEKGHSQRIQGIVHPEDGMLEEALRDHCCLVFANELLDAFAVHRLRYQDGAWKELYVGWDEAADRCKELTGPLSAPELNAFLTTRIRKPREGQTLEVGAEALAWIRKLGRGLRNGFAMLIDYGDTTQELTGPHRMNGTLLAYRNHAASDNVYAAPGRQDLTAHVNFEWCMEAARESGFSEVRLTTQKQFLIEQGVLERLRQHNGLDPFSEEARSNRAIRQLLLSDGMSELFKVMSMVKTDGE